MLWRRRTRALAIMVAIAVLVIAATFLQTAQTVGAYALPGTSEGQGNSATTISLSSLNFGSLFAPFQSFLNSIGSVGSEATPQLNLSAPQTQFLTTGAQNVFQQFDNWLYGIIGFHVSGFFAAILGVILWVLGIAESIVKWLLGVVK